MENCKMSGKSRGILRWMISGNPVTDRPDLTVAVHRGRKITTHNQESWNGERIPFPDKQLLPLYFCLPRHCESTFKLLWEQIPFFKSRPPFRRDFEHMKSWKRFPFIETAWKSGVYPFSPSKQDNALGSKGCFITLWQTVSTSRQKVC